MIHISNQTATQIIRMMETFNGIRPMRASEAEIRRRANVLIRKMKRSMEAKKKML